MSLAIYMNILSCEAVITRWRKSESKTYDDRNESKTKKLFNWNKKVTVIIESVYSIWWCYVLNLILATIYSLYSSLHFFWPVWAFVIFTVGLFFCLSEFTVWVIHHWTLNVSRCCVWCALIESIVCFVCGNAIRSHKLLSMGSTMPITQKKCLLVPF